MRRSVDGSIWMICLLVGVLCVAGLITVGLGVLLFGTAGGVVWGTSVAGYTRGLNPTAVDLNRGFAARFGSVAQAQVHLTYSVHVPHRLPPWLHLTWVQIDGDMVSTELVYTGRRGTLRVIESPDIAMLPTRRSRAVRVGGDMGKLFVSAHWSGVEWIHQHLYTGFTLSGLRSAQELLTIARAF